jgi:hypothetical protein
MKKAARISAIVLFVFVSAYTALGRPTSEPSRVTVQSRTVRDNDSRPALSKFLTKVVKWFRSAQPQESAAIPPRP